MDVRKLLTVPYGQNDHGDATYYYMHGTYGQYFCMDEDVGSHEWINEDDPLVNSVILSVDVNLSQTIWSQIMSQCHSSPGSGINGRGFWYKSDEYYSSLQLQDFASGSGIDIWFINQNITSCNDSSTDVYGCDDWDLGNSPYN